MSKFNFFDEVSVATTDFADKYIHWNFISAGLLLLNESLVSGDIIEYSFDGTTVHGNLDPDLPSAGISRDSSHESAIYFRLKTAGSAVTVRVEVWA